MRARIKFPNEPIKFQELRDWKPRQYWVVDSAGAQVAPAGFKTPAESTRTYLTRTQASRRGNDRSFASHSRRRATAHTQGSRTATTRSTTSLSRKTSSINGRSNSLNGSVVAMNVWTPSGDPLTGHQMSEATRYCEAADKVIVNLSARLVAAERVVEAARAAIADRWEYPDVAGIHNALDEYDRATDLNSGEPRG